MIIAEPCAAFASKARRFHLYLWKYGKVRYIRLPSGAGIYTCTKTETPLALQLPNGQAYRLELPPSRDTMGYFPLWRDFTPVSFGALRAQISIAEGVTTAIKSLSVRQLCDRFGDIPVAPEDAYASGQCWYGSKAWAEKWLGSPAPPVSLMLSRLSQLPTIEVPAFISAAAYAAAYVAGTDRTFIEGAGLYEYRIAVAEGRKADGSGAFRLSKLNADIHGNRRDGEEITRPDTASSPVPG